MIMQVAFVLERVISNALGTGIAQGGVDGWDRNSDVTEVYLPVS